ncbi:MAG: hypothetical protein GDA51_13370 [Ekhidna sp.]|nr:hypothetical protein [Ekhidna sp.]MBC6427421.1 hypothetical protein [Ekhidna sp.]
MKRIISLINLLAFATVLYGQEKMSYQLNGKNVEFTISQERMYLEYAANQKSAVQKMSTTGLQELTNNAAIIKVSEPKGTFQRRKQSLQSKISFDLQRIEPVLIYKDGTEQIAAGELNIKLKPNASIEDIEELLKGKSYTSQRNAFDKHLYLVTLNLATTELFNLVNQLQKESRLEFAEPNFIRINILH